MLDISVEVMEEGVTPKTNSKNLQKSSQNILDLVVFFFKNYVTNLFRVIDIHF